MDGALGEVATSVGVNLVGDFRAQSGVRIWEKLLNELPMKSTTTDSTARRLDVSVIDGTKQGA
jgi:hypothetical protein